jgi:hypothetical protein
LFLRRFFVCTGSGVVEDFHRGMITVQFIPTLLLEAGLPIEQPAKMCPSMRRRLAMAG